MKKVLFVALLVLAWAVVYRSMGGFSDSNSARGATAVRNAPGASGAKLTLLDFTGSDWCGWCQKLDREVFSQPEFRQFARDNIIFTKVDFPRNIPQSPAERAQNAELAQRYGVRGFPTIVVLNSKGKEVGRLGYMPGGPKPFVEALKRLPSL
jgi:thioredoxin-related protein